MSEATPSATKSNWRLEAWFPDLSQDIFEKLSAINKELVATSRSTPIVSLKTVPFADAIHFADSILALRAIMSDLSKPTRIFDLGLGTGFPSLVGAVLFPGVQFVSVHQDPKKNEYIRRCVDNIGLSNMTIEPTNVEALPENSVDIAITRGVANISKAILMARKCIPKGGVLYHMKSENWSMEVGEIPTQLCSVWAPALVKEYRLPVGEVRFAVVKTDKIA